MVQKLRLFFLVFLFASANGFALDELKVPVLPKVAASSSQKNAVIAIFYTPHGEGHKSAAFSLKDEIFRVYGDGSVINASADGKLLVFNSKEHGIIEVHMRDITDYKWPAAAWIEKKVFELAQANVKVPLSKLTTPEIWDASFEGFVSNGESGKSLVNWMFINNYAPYEILKDLQNMKADVAATTISFLGDILVYLKNNQHLEYLKFFWQHTDLIPRRVFSNLAKNADMVGVGEESIRDFMVEEGVDPAKVVTMGPYIQQKSMVPMTEDERVKFMRDNGLDPYIPTVTIINGKNAAGPFSQIITRLSEDVTKPFQVVAICGTNRARERELLKLAQSLKAIAGITLHVIGPEYVANKVRAGVYDEQTKMLPVADVLRYLQVSSVAISKAGGRTSLEMFSVGVPALLTSQVGGQEAYNPWVMKRAGLAMVNERIDEIGKQANELILNPEIGNGMLQAQAKYRRFVNNPAPVEFLVKTAAQRNFVKEKIPSRLVRCKDFFRFAINASAGPKILNF